MAKIRWSLLSNVGVPVLCGRSVSLGHELSWSAPLQFFAHEEILLSSILLLTTFFCMQIFFIELIARSHDHPPLEIGVKNSHTYSTKTMVFPHNDNTLLRIGEFTPLLPGGTTTTLSISAVVNNYSDDKGLDYNNIVENGSSGTERQVVHPLVGLAPLINDGGIAAYDDRLYIPRREASTIKSLPAYAPYMRMARHRSFYLRWMNVRFEFLFLFCLWR